MIIMIRTARWGMTAPKNWLAAASGPSHYRKALGGPLLKLARS